MDSRTKNKVAPVATTETQTDAGKEKAEQESKVQEKGRAARKLSGRTATERGMRSSDSPATEQKPDRQAGEHPSNPGSSGRQDQAGPDADGEEKESGEVGQLQDRPADEPTTKVAERGDLVRHLAELIEKRIGSNEYKPTVADFLKLLEYEEASKDQETRKVEVRWVDQKD